MHLSSFNNNICLLIFDIWSVQTNHNKVIQAVIFDQSKQSAVDSLTTDAELFIQAYYLYLSHIPLIRGPFIYHPNAL